MKVLFHDKSFKLLKSFSLFKFYFFLIYYFIYFKIQRKKRFFDNKFLYFKLFLQVWKQK